MISVSKGLLITILTSIAILLIMNMIYFIPWYMTLISESFNITQTVSTDNYMKDTDQYLSLSRIRSRPVFNKNPSLVTLEVLNSDGRSAVGDDNPEIYYDQSEWLKPYRQRGEPITVTLSASYELSISLWGTEYTKLIPVAYTLRTTGLRHYKDLP